MFTESVLREIPKLVESQYTRAEIASILRVSEGSLKVTCSHLGIALRAEVPRGKTRRMVVLSKDAERRLASFATEHDVSLSALCTELLERIAVDGLIEAVLDEDKINS